jgi:hypothetical protein
MEVRSSHSPVSFSKGTEEDNDDNSHNDYNDPLRAQSGGTPYSCFRQHFDSQIVDAFVAIVPSSVGGSGTGEVATAEPATGPTSIVAVAVGDTLISPSSFSWLQVANRAATSPLKGAMRLLPSL